jgi:hypothetical protein
MQEILDKNIFIYKSSWSCQWLVYDYHVKEFNLAGWLSFESKQDALLI